MIHGLLELTRAGGGHDGEGLGGTRVHRGSVVRLGRVRLGVGDLGGSLGVVRLGVSLNRGGVGGVVRLGVSLDRGGVGGVVRLGVRLNRGGRGGARGGPGLGGTSPGLVLTPALGGVVRSDSGALSGGDDEVLTTSLHDTGEGRAGNKGQEGDGVDHFERLKPLLKLGKITSEAVMGMKFEDGQSSRPYMSCSTV